MRETWATLRELLLPDGASLDATRPRRHLETQLRTAITSGRLVPGARLPSTRDLARQLNVSRGTTLAVYEQLVAEGYLESK
ncbi:GntR family transcriptional regulator [Streptomyces netropsis]